MKYLLLCTLFFSSFSFAESRPYIPKGSTGGRFQIVQISEMRRDQYLIDTETGRLWVNICVGGARTDCTSSYWRQEVIENIYAVQQPSMSEAPKAPKKTLHQLNPNEYEEVPTIKKGASE